MGSRSRSTRRGPEALPEEQRLRSRACCDARPQRRFNLPESNLELTMLSGKRQNSRSASEGKGGRGGKIRGEAMNDSDVMLRSNPAPLIVLLENHRVPMLERGA